MKILYISSSIIPSQKANSIQVIRMCDAFSELGHSVVLFGKTTELEPKYTENYIKKYYGIKNNFSIYNIKSSSLRFVGGLEYAYKLLKKIKELNIRPDLVYGRNIYGLLACLSLKRPIIFESHVAPVIERKPLENFLFTRKCFKSLVVISKALFDYYKNNFEIFQKHPEKIILAVDGAEIPFQLSLDTDKKSRMPLIVGYAGSLYEGKGIEKIIEIAKVMPNYNFVVAGGSKRQIQNLKETTKLDNISFKGYIQPSLIPIFLRECDILLAPYSNEVFSEIHEKRNLAKWMSPLKIFEYMAVQRPIVATNLPAIKEILTDNKTALLADFDNIVDWKNKIELLLNDSDLAEKISRNAFEEFKNNYTWKKRAEKIIKDIDFIKKQETDSVSAKIPTILHIIGDLNVGGAERSMLKILSDLNNRKFKHRIITLFELGFLAKDFKNVGIEVETLNIPKSFSLFKAIISILKLVKKIKSIKPVAIHTWLYHSNNLINMLSLFFRNTPVINSIRHGNPNKGSFKTRISAIFGAFISRISNNTQVYCSKNSLISHLSYNYPNEKSVVINNGFIVPDIDKRQSKANIRAKYNIPNDYKIIINVGRYSPEKDYLTLLEAMKLAFDKYSNVVLILCGKGLDDTNQEIIDIADKLSIRKHIRLLGNKSNIEKLMAGADFLVSSSYSEAFPNVIVEAMSVGTPCISTNAGESANIIGNTGLVVPVRDVLELSKAIIKFLNIDDENIISMGIKAKERIAQNYSLKKCLNKYEKLYESIIYNCKDG